jgi:hypothetical protein
MVDRALNAEPDLPWLVFTSGNLFAVVFGALAITAEYGSKTILRTYQIAPNRPTVLLAKLAALCLLAALGGVVASSTGVAVLAGSGQPDLHVPQPVALIAAYTANMMLMAILSYGVGLLLSRTVATIVTLVGLVYVVPDAVRLLCANFLPSFQRAYLWLPSEASRCGVMASLHPSDYGGVPVPLGLATATLAAALLVAVGIMLQRRKDII